jgi:hypothetical protein
VSTYNVHQQYRQNLSDTKDERKEFKAVLSTRQASSTPLHDSESISSAPRDAGNTAPHTPVDNKAHLAPRMGSSSYQQPKQLLSSGVSLHSIALARHDTSSGSDSSIARGNANLLHSVASMGGVSPETPAAAAPPASAKSRTSPLTDAASMPFLQKSSAGAPGTPEQNAPNLTAITEEKRDINEVSVARTSTLNTTMHVSAPSSILQAEEQPSRLRAGTPSSGAPKSEAAVAKQQDLLQVSVASSSAVEAPRAIRPAFAAPTLSSKSSPRSNRSNSSSTDSSSTSDSSSHDKAKKLRSDAAGGSSNAAASLGNPNDVNEAKKKKEPFWKRIFS